MQHDYSLRARDGRRTPRSSAPPVRPGEEGKRERTGRANANLSNPRVHRLFPVDPHGLTLCPLAARPRPPAALVQIYLGF